MSLEEIMPEIKLANKKSKSKSTIIDETKKDKSTKQSIKLKKGKSKKDHDDGGCNDSDSDADTFELDDVAKKYQKKSQLEHIKDFTRYIYWKYY